MTEDEWLTGEDIWEMLEFLQGKASDRQLRLFGCACVRLLWALEGEAVPPAVEVAELFADHLVGQSALRAGRVALRREMSALEEADAGMRPMWALCWLATVAASDHDFGSVVAQLNECSEVLILQDDEWARIRDLLREVFGNPFRRKVPDPAWLVWNGGIVVKLAQGIYEDRAFDRMTILADALEESGCPDQDLLTHCRQATGHVRGCWALDFLTARE
jgi:hypothetical protein